MVRPLRNFIPTFNRVADADKRVRELKLDDIPYRTTSIWRGNREVIAVQFLPRTVDQIDRLANVRTASK